VDVVLLGEADGEGAFERVEIFHDELHDFGAFGVVEKESCLWVFVGLGFAGFQGAGCSWRFGFAFEKELLVMAFTAIASICLHCLKHLES